MSERWVTVAEAAAALKVHPRTIERRIKSASLQSRRADAGQVEVLIDAPDPDANPMSDPLSVVAGQADQQVQLALGATSALVKGAQEDARLARHDSERAWEETHLARRETQNARHGARLAWGLVALMGVGAGIAVAWTAATVTRARADLEHTHSELRQMSDIAGQSAAERDRLRGDLEEAEIDRAKAQGELTAMKSAVAQNARQQAKNSDSKVPDKSPDTISAMLAPPGSRD
ncbi:MAG: hypothetical protein JWO87_3982 [Phycisphaerales bacterium]|jgi:hypothetical protein|nr:hypothetical protein [Phycisphaerales bacterium]MDB5304042.1 hypothetical protein [Phycisphaerales bacterium]